MSLLLAALADLAELALGCSNCRAGLRQTLQAPSLPAGLGAGGVVDLSSPSAALRVGVSATPADCEQLARRLLGQRSADAMSLQLVRGAMCELAYLLAGGVKRRLAGWGPLTVGQPVYFEGSLTPRSGWDTRTTVVELDGIRATLLGVARSDLSVLL